MVSIVIVSHSQKLADSVTEIALLMARTAKIEAVGGNDDGDFGSSESKIIQAIEKMYTEDGTIVIADIGSSVNTAKSAIKKVIESGKTNVVLADCPMIEGAIAAAVMSSVDMPMSEVVRQAEDAKNLKKA